MIQDFPKKPRKTSDPKSVLKVLGDSPYRTWYPIDNRLKGYEVSDDGYVRSLKSRKKEYGCMIKPINGTYSLTDENGNIVRLDLDEIQTLAKNNPYRIARKTNEITAAGRNKRAFQVKDSDYNNDFLKQPVQVHFTIVEDSKAPNTKVRKAISPIYQILREDTNNGNQEEG